MANYKDMPEAEEMALWKKTSTNGKEHLSGVVKINGESFRVVAFFNTKKQGKQPDYSFTKIKREDDTQEIINSAFPNEA